MYSFALILVTPKKYDTKEKGKGVNLSNSTVFQPLSVTTESNARKLLCFFRKCFLNVLLSQSLEIKKAITAPKSIANVIKNVAEVKANKVLEN